MLTRAMLPSDLNAVVAIHQTAFAGFFLTRMGPHFLRAYYQAVLDFEASIALVSCEPDTNRMLGFAVGFRDPQGFYALFNSRKRRLLPSILLAVLRDPGLLPAILRNMRRVEAQASHPVDAVELSSIAVGESRRGAGGALLEAFAAEARTGSASRLLLTTDESGNDPVRAFYEARGFTLDGIEKRGARRLCRYVRALG